MKRVTKTFIVIGLIVILVGLFIKYTPDYLAIMKPAPPGIHGHFSSAYYDPLYTPLAQVYRWNKSPDLFRLSLRLQTHEYARRYEKSTNQSYLEPALFLDMVHALASVDAGIIGAGHETMHQSCFLAFKERYFNQRKKILASLHSFSELRKAEAPWLQF